MIDLSTSGYILFLMVLMGWMIIIPMTLWLVAKTHKKWLDVRLLKLYLDYDLSIPQEYDYLTRKMWGIPASDVSTKLKRRK